MIREQFPEARAEIHEHYRGGPLRHVADALRGLQFGTVTVVVQDGVVVQVERMEKVRLSRGSRRSEA
jgi:hypothetical protein